MKSSVIIPASVPKESFKQYLFGNRGNRIALWVAATAIVIQFTVFKYFYPFASFIHGDSFKYMDTAFYNLDINIYPVGYSRFLRFISVFTRSDLALVGLQYLFIQGSALFFLYTLFYFYRPGKVVRVVLFLFMVLNPLCLHLANLISSDGIFVAISLIWITLLLWIIHRPRTCVLAWHTLVLFIAFTVRYNALIYPAIAVAVILLSKLPVGRKIAGIGAMLMLCGLFILYTGNKYQELTGKWQYSPFSGWQIANNAMYAYRYVDSADRKPVPDRFKELDNIVRAHFDKTRERRHPLEAEMAGTIYMWSWGLPLFRYKNELFKRDTTSATEFKIWASMGPFYSAYGSYIIKQYPLYFLKYFLWPNAQKYYAPPLEFMETYNSGIDSVTTLTQVWFRYKSNKVSTRTHYVHIGILEFYPICSGVVNVVMLLSLLCFAVLNGFRMAILFRKGVMLASSIWLLNAGFTIFASSAALRFQSFPIFLTTTFALLLTDFLWKVALNGKKGSQSITERDEHSDLSTGGSLPAEVAV